MITQEDLEEYAEDDDRDRRHDAHERGACDPGACDWCQDDTDDSVTVLTPAEHPESNGMSHAVRKFGI